ncbi:MAG: trypsin-like peptidase domain-containing protein [Thermomicrobiales bacterium]
MSNPSYNNVPRSTSTSPLNRIRTVFIALLFLVTAGFGLTQTELFSADHTSTPPIVESTTSANLLSAQTEDDTTRSIDLSAADVAELANPAVVTVYNLQTAQSEGILPGDDVDEDPQAVGTGSGWIYSEDGYVITNAHVVEGSESVVVQFFDGSTADADVTGVDAVQDVAVLKLSPDDGLEVPGVLAIGDSTALRPGEDVVAIGNPLGEYANSVTTGTIGGLNRSLANEVGGSVDNLLQHNADISSGNSGGPLLNMQAEFIGMNVAKIDSTGQQNVSISGLNFAIDGNTVVDRVEQIIANGEVVYPYLGVETAETIDGVQVMSVVPNGPAENAGLEEGDIITAVADEQLTPSLSLSQLLFQHNAGDTIDLTIDRDGETMTLSVTLGERPESLS